MFSGGTVLDEQNGSSCNSQRKTFPIQAFFSGLKCQHVPLGVSGLWGRSIRMLAAPKVQHLLVVLKGVQRDGRAMRAKISLASVGWSFVREKGRVSCGHLWSKIYKALVFEQG